MGGREGRGLEVLVRVLVKGLGVGWGVLVVEKMGARPESRVGVDDRKVLLVVRCALLLLKRVHLDKLDGCLVCALSRKVRLRYEVLIRRVPISLQVSTLNRYYLGLIRHKTAGA